MEAPYPSLTEDITVDACVVGGGIAGMAAAFWLQVAGVNNVAVLDRRRVASGASGRNAGFVMAVAPENFPKSEDPAEKETARRIWAFTAENQRLMEETLQKLEVEAEYRRLGSLGLAAYPAEWERIKATTDVAHEAGLQVDILERDDLPSKWLKEHYFGGAWYPDNAEIDPVLFVRGIASWLADRGVRVFETSPVDAIEEDGKGWRLETRGQKIKAQDLVIATNAYTFEILPGLGSIIKPTRGQVLATSPIEVPVAGCPVYANDGYQYWRQTAAGRLLVGGWRNLDIEGEIGTSEDLSPRIQQELERVANGLFGAPVDVQYRWSGIMGFTPDRRPLVGPLPGRHNAVISAGYSGHGLAMALHASKHAVDMLLGLGSEYRDLFDPARFGDAS